MDLLFELYAARYPIAVRGGDRQKAASKEGHMASLKVIRESDNHVLTVGDFQLDFDHRSVLIRDRELRLTLEEFDLLVFLAAHPKRIITSHTMLRTRCGNGRLRQVEMLPTLLSLRQKLQTVADGSRYIRTEPWVCYRFEPDGL